MLRNRLSFWKGNIFKYILHKIICTFFILFIDYDLFAAGNQFLFDLVAEIIIDVAESKHIFVNGIILQPLHGLVKLVVLGLEVLKLELLSQDHLIESTSKVCINKLSLHQCFANESANKLEVVEMVRIYV